MLYCFLSFFNKNALTFICNYYSEKESLKIGKVTSNTGSFIWFVKWRKNYTYCLANLRNIVFINQILPDTLFKPQRKNKKYYYHKPKSQFILAYFIFYFHVCAQKHFTISCKFYMLQRIQNIRLSTSLNSRFNSFICHQFHDLSIRPQGRWEI